MQTMQKPKTSIGEQVVRGLSVGCSLLVFIQVYFWLTFHSRRPVEIDKLYAATNEALFISGLTLLIASLAMLGSRPKLAGWGMMIALVAILAGWFSPLIVVRA